MTDKQYVKVAAHGLIVKDNKFLVTKRPSHDDYMPNFWDTQVVLLILEKR
jgi:hypothetical protein